MKVKSIIYINKWGSKCDVQPYGSCINKEEGKFSGPTGLAIDPLDNVYVADNNNNRIQKFSNDGSFITEWRTRGTNLGFFQDANSIAVDNDGFVYVVDNNNNRIQNFNSDGTFVSAWAAGQNPFGTAVDNDGFVYVTSFIEKSIIKFTNDGEFVTKWGYFGNEDGQFRYPWRIDVDYKGNVFVSDITKNNIYVFA
jgi:tripartite motif-containing protein 71